MLDKYKAMTPEQEETEFRLRMERRARIARYRENYEAANPDDPFVKARHERQVKARHKRRKRVFARSLAKVKQTGKRAVSMARNAVLTGVSSILSVIGVSVVLLGKINSTVKDIGRDVRSQTMGDMRYNFSEGFTRQWERFAEKRGFDKDVLSQAAGGIAAAWSTPLNYSSSNFDALAPYLGESTRILVRQADANGDKNVLHIMSDVIDDLVSKSMRGKAGPKQYTGQSRMHDAFTENMSALQSHNGAWARLMQYYWYDLIAPDGKFVKAAAAAGKEANFENWMQQVAWNPEYMEDGNGMTNAPVKTAAERTYEAVNNLKNSLSSLRTDVLERIAGSLIQLAEDVRSKIVNLLTRYFPAFAMKERERAVYLNVQGLANAENNLPGYRATARTGLKATGYPGSLDDFEPIWEGLLKRDPKVLADLPATVSMEALDTFIRYQAAPYYETAKVVSDINRENEKLKENPNYSPRAVIYDPSTNATRFTSLGMAAYFGLQNIKVQQQAPKVNSGGADFLRRLWTGNLYDTDPNRPIYQIMNRLGLQMITDLMTGQQVGQRMSALSKEAQEKELLSHRIQGTYARYKTLEDRIRGYRNVSDNGVLLMSPAGQVLSDAQAMEVTGNFHAAEKELYDYLAAMYETKNPQHVLNAYDVLAAFYHRYGRFARVTDSAEAARMREEIRQGTKDTFMGDFVADISSVFSPSEVMEMLRAERSKYVHLNRLEGELLAYQHSQTLPLQAFKQNLTNDATIPMALIEQTNAALLKRPDLPNNILDALQMPGSQGLTFDVDEEAIKNKTAVVTNVYLELRGRPPVKILGAVNTGLPRDVRVAVGQDTMQALLEALSATQ
jgi:hypothetical protein